VSKALDSAQKDRMDRLEVVRVDERINKKTVRTGKVTLCCPFIPRDLDPTDFLYLLQ